MTSFGTAAGYNPEMYGYGAAPGSQAQFISQAQWGQGESYGFQTAPQPTKGTFLRGQRRRLNVVPIIMCVLVPWLMFCATYWVTAFSIHYENPSLFYLMIGGLFVVVAIVAVMALSKRIRWFSNAEEAPSWLIVLALSLFLAWVVGFFTGDMNYAANMQRYYDMNNLNNYTNVYPNRMRGQQLMDAGQIKFAEGTRIDISKSMGFKNSHTYCVAPITYGATPPATYDFWVIGVDCCTSNLANFHCEGANNPRANGGLRLMLDNDRAFYRLAVQQAEATYKIKAAHPLFFRWVQDPVEMVNSWKLTGQSDFLVWVFSSLVFQLFIVGFATLVFSKLGY